MTEVILNICKTCHAWNCESRAMSLDSISVQVYALVAIACIKLGRAVQLHSSRSEVRVLLSLSKKVCSDVQISQIIRCTQCTLHLYS